MLVFELGFELGLDLDISNIHQHILVFFTNSVIKGGWCAPVFVSFSLFWMERINFVRFIFLKNRFPLKKPRRRRHIFPIWMRWEHFPDKIASFWKLRWRWLEHMFDYNRTPIRQSLGLTMCALQAFRLSYEFSSTHFFATIFWSFLRIQFGCAFGGGEVYLPSFKDHNRHPYP